MSNFSTPFYGLGIDQTVQDLTGSRAFNTTYTNTTDKPIFVHVNSRGGSLAFAYLTINGLTVMTNRNDASNGMRAGSCGIVPVGGTYSASGTGTLTWYETR